MGKTFMVFVTLLSFTACTTLQPLPDAQPGTIQQAVQPGDKVEIERTDGTKQVLTVEEVTGDILQGIDGKMRYRVPLSSIKTIAKRSMTTSDKVWTAVGVAVAVGAIIAVASDGGGGGGGGGGGY